jgi:signal transduction histidine kinase
MTHRIVAMSLNSPRHVYAVAVKHIRQGKKQLKISKLPGKDTIARLGQFLRHAVYSLTKWEIRQKVTSAQLSLERSSKHGLQEMLWHSDQTFYQLVEKIQIERKEAAETRLALEKEREINELKSRFIAVTSHEFRTPLTSILLCCEFLRDHNHKLSEDTKQRYFELIKSSVKHLDQIIEDVLLINRAQAGKVEFNPIPLDLVKFCFNLVEQLQIVAGEHYNIVFTSHCSYNCKANRLPSMDEKLLRYILTNLLSNAIKYSPQGGNILFDLVCDLESVTFQIQDQGIGIPKEEQPMLFTSFFRCSNIGNLPGTGLGLTIVKNAVELHGGQISVESEVGLGTTFTVILPLHHTVTVETN